jgi:hypothetical protein
MSRGASRITGWVLIAVAVVCALTTVPIWNVRGTATGGSMTVDSSPLGTTAVGDGQFTHEAFWSVSWVASIVCGLALAGGVLLVLWRSGHTAPPITHSA